jgi:xylose isomerase
MTNTFFPEVTGPIPFEGKDSKNPLAFKYYDKNRKVGTKTMADHLRFSVAYWHTMMGTGADMFGSASVARSWKKASDPMDRARQTMEAAFEFMQKLGVDFYCFHDRDIAPSADTFAKTCTQLEEIVGFAAGLQKSTGIRLLWGTANLFSDPVFAQGAGTSPNAHVMALAAAQVKHALDATKALGGENYVFWGGREGYESLLNTDLKHEQEQMARFLHMVVDYKKKIGFTGQFLIEPKPAEPMKHQYDATAAETLFFLKQHDLYDHFKLNIEANHATLAGHTFEHELAVASAAGKLGSVDANRGDLMLGWDTDQFPTDIYSTTLAMMVILGQDGLGSGGLNFDAKVRRTSTDPTDLFYAHIGGMDAFARGLLIAQKLREEKVFETVLANRYATYTTGIGASMMAGKSDLTAIDAWIMQNDSPVTPSARQEMLENILNSYIA